MAINCLSRCGVGVDKVLDYVPGVSFVTNAIDIVVKIALKIFSSPSRYEAMQNNELGNHLINKKSYLDCVKLAIPFLNIYFAVRRDCSRPAKEDASGVPDLQPEPPKSMRNISTLNVLETDPDVNPALPRLVSTSSTLEPQQSSHHKHSKSSRRLSLEDPEAHKAPVVDPTPQRTKKHSTKPAAATPFKSELSASVTTPAKSPSVPIPSQGTPISLPSTVTSSSKSSRALVQSPAPTVTLSKQRPPSAAEAPNNDLPTLAVRPKLARKATHVKTPQKFSLCKADSEATVSATPEKPVQAGSSSTSLASPEPIDSQVQSQENLRERLKKTGSHPLLPGTMLLELTKKLNKGTQ